jgi:hypothetical protein
MSALSDIGELAEGLKLLLEARKKLAKFRSIRFLCIAATQIDIAVALLRGYLRGEDR